MRIESGTALAHVGRLYGRSLHCETTAARRCQVRPPGSLFLCYKCGRLKFLEPIVRLSVASHRGTRRWHTEAACPCICWELCTVGDRIRKCVCRNVIVWSSKWFEVREWISRAVPQQTSSSPRSVSTHSAVRAMPAQRVRRVAVDQRLHMAGRREPACVDRVRSRQHGNHTGQRSSGSPCDSLWEASESSSHLFSTVEIHS